MRLIRIREAAEQTNLSISTIRRLIRSGALPAIRPSPGTLRIEANDLQRYLISRTVTQPPGTHGTSEEELKDAVHL